MLDYETIRKSEFGYAVSYMKFFWQRILRLAPVKSAALVMLLASLCNVVSGQEVDKGYQLGRGLPLGDTGIRLGGYMSTRVQGLGSMPWSFNLASLSLFTTWDNGSKLRYFSETELEGGLTAGQNQDLSTRDGHFDIERMYIEYLATDHVTLRLGKFLTPIGQWNLIHVEPLVWTSSRPVATTNLFSDYATGAMVLGNFMVAGRNLEYSVYHDYSSSLDPVHGAEGGLWFDNAQGLRLRYYLDDNLKIGLSYADYALVGSSNSRNHLAGLDFIWTYQRYILNAEAVYRNKDVVNVPLSACSFPCHPAPSVSAYANRNAWQGYIQGVAPLTDTLYGVARFEFFDQANLGFDDNERKFGHAQVFGLAYRPHPALVFKVEYRFGNHNRTLAPDEWLSSIGVLF
jgi:hypothetical protein